MTATPTTVPFGRPASEALDHAIRTAKAGRALAPVTVIVPSNFAGLAARRLLGSGTVGSGGLANVGFVTPFRLAELVAADRLLDRSPLTNPVLGAAVRLALADDPGPFAAVKDHQATEAALAAVYTELSNVGPDALDRIGASGRAGATAVRFHRSIGARLTGFHDEADLVRAATEHPQLAALLAPFGHLVWHLPAPMTAPLARFVGAALAAAPSSVIIGVTTDEKADALTWATCRQAGVSPPASPSVSDLPTATAIISVTDADEEVRAVVREIAALLEGAHGDPVPLDRIGVFHATPDPYVRILEQQLAAAGIPANGPSRRRLGETAAGRTLLAALRLPAQQWRRDRVMALVSSAPLRAGDDSARPATWEEISREAGVVQHRTDWARKLAAHRAQLEGELAALDPEVAPRPHDHLTRRLADVAALDEFVEALGAGVDAVDRAVGWPAKVHAALALLHQLLGTRHPSWPEDEQAALERVEDALGRLASLDHLEPAPPLDVFVRALTAELDVTHGRQGRFGDGVMYGPLASAVGLDFDAVFILGCTEGLCPSPRRDDAMLPDHVRELASGELALRADRLHDQHRQFLAALATAPAARRTLTAPRGSLRASRGPLPSRWLLDSASAIEGAPVYATDYVERTDLHATVVPSHAAGMLTAPVPASLVEHDVMALAAHLARDEHAGAHPAGRLVERGLAAQAARRSADFTEWDGNLAGEPIPSTGDRPLSPSRLQKWAQCGFRYYLGYTLGLSDRDDPERIIELNPLDRGSAIHAALERFLLEAIEAGLPEPDEPWSPADHERLRAIVEEELDQLADRGRTGRELLWRTNRSDLVRLLDGFLDADDEHRKATRSRAEQLEMRFGFDDGVPPVRLTLPDGRELSFRGAFDRADRGADGRWYVTDYKTGQDAAFKGIDAKDPTSGGTLLQLGLYAEAAIQHLGAEEVDAHYWVINPRTGDYGRHGYAWTEERRERFVEVLTAIADGIEGGAYPMVPGEYNLFRQTHDNCAFCEFDGVCPSARGEQASVKVDAPGLRARGALQWEPAG